jgi:hypothetical protein
MEKNATLLHVLRPLATTCEEKKLPYRFPPLPKRWHCLRGHC